MPGSLGLNTARPRSRDTPPSAARGVMPLFVSVHYLSGQAVELTMPSSANVLTLKQTLHKILMVKPKRQQLIQVDGGRLLLDVESLYSIAHSPAWLHLEHCPQWIPLEAELHLIVTSHCCGYCQKTAPIMKRCSRCSIHYCDEICQAYAWPAHRRTCSSIIV